MFAEVVDSLHPPAGLEHARWLCLASTPMPACVLQPDGQRHPEEKAVRGAVQDFAAMVGRQVFITWGTSGCNARTSFAPALACLQSKCPNALTRASVWGLFHLRLLPCMLLFLFAEDPQYPSWVMRR